MNREYDTGTYNNIEYFLGNEIEHTKFYGKYTLFVASTPEPETILKLVKTYEAEHVYLGANKIFSDKIPWKWVNKVVKLLSQNKIYVTLDLTHKLWEDAIHNLGNSEWLNINVSVEMPNVEVFNNISVKVDDVDFNATNPGIWVLDLDKKDGIFNDWSAYQSDTIVKG